MIVEFPDGWFLRGTTATSSRDRATRFPSEAAARVALAVASKFLKKAAVRAARIVQ